MVAAIPAFLIALVALAIVAVLVAALVKLMWRVAEPDQALIITGLGAGGRDVGSSALGPSSSLGFKIVAGKGAFVTLGLQTVRPLGLEAHKTDLRVECVTTQGIPVHVRGVVVYKVGDEFAEIANAARRFLGQEHQMDANVHEIMAEARAIEAKGMAEAATVKAKLTVEAEGIEARARALEKNQQAVIQQALVEQLPETVRAAAEACRGIDHLVVMNGAEGMNEITGQVLGAGLATLPLLQDLLNGRNGAREREEERPAPS